MHIDLLVISRYAKKRKKKVLCTGILISYVGSAVEICVCRCIDALCSYTLPPFLIIQESKGERINTVLLEILFGFIKIRQFGILFFF